VPNLRPLGCAARQNGCKSHKQTCNIHAHHAAGLAAAFSTAGTVTHGISSLQAGAVGVGGCAQVRHTQATKLEQTHEPIKSTGLSKNASVSLLTRVLPGGDLMTQFCGTAQRRKPDTLQILER
jgi:hypothetical protein